MPFTKTIEETIVCTLHSAAGNLLCTVGDSRYMLAKFASVDIDIIRQSEKIKSGGVPVRVFTGYFSIVLCDEMTFTSDTDIPFLESVRAYDFEVKLQRKDGMYENVVFRNMTLTDIDLVNNKWNFKVYEQNELMNRLKDF